MTALAVINPVRRRRRKMTAKQLKYFGPRKHRSARRSPKRRNPVHRRRRASVRRSPVRVYVRNPRRRRSYSARRRFAAVRGKFRGVTGKLKNYGMRLFIPSLIGGAGALALDAAWGYLPVPAAINSNQYLAAGVRLAGAVSIGALVGMVAGKKFGTEVAAGATVVTLYDVVKGWLQTAYPGLPLSMYIGHGGGRYNPGLNIGRQRRLNMYIGEYTPFYNNEASNDSDLYTYRDAGSAY
jgi:hypothetical protein